MAFLREHKESLNNFSGLDFGKVDEDMFNWGWMTLGTRCFGTHHLPCEIAMAPLLDLANHDNEQEKLKYFVEPYELHRKMLTRSVDKMTNEALDYDY
jgi:hypothetical protein